ncbi:porin family protein [Spirosoma koreense]
MKPFYPLVALILLPAGLAFAQASGSTTSPTSTTSTNRQQELYDQYHGITKKPATTAPVTTPAQTQRRTSDYSGSSSSSTTSRTTKAYPEASTSGTRIGIRAGGTYSFFTEQQSLFKPTAGFVGGLTFNFGAGAVSFQPEINYARYGLKLEDSFTGISIKGAADVIEVPLLVKFSSGTYAGNRFFVNVGPYASYLASESTNGKKTPIDTDTERFSFGGALGLGAAIKAGPGHVTVEARGMYTLGSPDTGFNTDTRVIRSQLTVGYSFPLSGR